MTQRDLMKIRARVIQEGIPYQSLISIVLGKAAEGERLSPVNES